MPLLWTDGHYRAGVPQEEVRLVKELEISHLDLRWAHTRIARDCHSLAVSLAKTGQIVPVIVSKDLVVLDGYLRIKALSSLGRDTVMAEIWDLGEQEALAQLLARSKGRPWDTIEEAALLCELHHHLSQEKIAAMVGRTQGWVSTRLALYRNLPDELLGLIRKGSISTWTAMRVIVPIARAMPEHGRILTGKLGTTSFSTRDMQQFFDHYKKANQSRRQRMVDDPSLFLKSLQVHEEQGAAKVLREGPEGTWLRDLRVVTHILARLTHEVPALFPPPSNLDRRLLLTAFEESRKEFLRLESRIRSSDDHGRNEAGHCQSSYEGGPHPDDQPAAQALPEHRQAGDPGLYPVSPALPV